ncbi:MAG: TerB family tellurite resistance protein [Bauldia sp.]|nr:TerB family tellurite resistance protein [Bauldia sp.]
MLKAMRQLLSDITRPSQPETSDPNDERLAAAALLVHVVNVDGTVGDDERKRLQELVAERFGLADAEAQSLIDRAHAADVEAVDLYRFTSILKAKLDEAGRLRVIEMMWEMAFADGEVHEFEENVMWRVAELLGVPSRERVRLKQLVRNRTAH